MKKIPPFAKELYKLQKQGLRPIGSVYLWIGNQAWHKGKNFAFTYPSRCLVLPPWESPDAYIWPVKQCDILIFDTGYAELDYVDELAASLYQFEADIVRYISPTHVLSVYHKE